MGEHKIVKGPVTRYMDYVARRERGEDVEPVESPVGGNVASLIGAGNELKKRLIGLELLSEKFLLVEQQRGEQLIYKIEDLEKKEVSCLGGETGLLKKEVSRNYDHLPDVLKLVKGKEMTPIKQLPVPLVKEIVEKFKIEQGREKTEVKSFAWKGDDSFTLKRLDFDLTDGPTPCWDEFLSRCDERKAVEAFIWSIFEPKHVGRQALYLRGLGVEGKSKVIETIATFLGTEAAQTLSAGTDGARFDHAKYYGKRLLAYPDCRFPSFVKSELFRNYTGGDLVSVEFKYLNPFTKRAYARVMIGSNFAPNIDNEKSDRSRLIIVHVAPLPKAGDGSALGGRLPEAEWVAGLVREMPHALYKFRRTYEEVCEGHTVIRVDDPERHDEKLGNASEASEADFELICAENGIGFSLEGEASRLSLQKIIREERLSTSERNMFVKWLEKKGVRLKAAGPKANRRRVWAGMTIAADSVEAEALDRLNGPNRGVSNF